MSQKYFVESWQLVQDKINLINQDGRYYINHTANEFDIIILNIGDPLNANINRFYTIEFFEKIKSILSPSGIFSFQLTSSENYLSQELIKLLQIVNKSLQEVFVEIKIIPGETIHFFATSDVNISNLQAKYLVSQLANRGIENHFVNEFYLNFKLFPERINELEELIQPQNLKPTVILCLLPIFLI